MTTLIKQGEKMLTDEQLVLHNAHITGSKVAGILGLEGAFKGKFPIFCEMRGDIEPDKESTIRMRMGNYMEAGIKVLCESEYGWKFKDLPDDDFIEHPEYPFIGGIIDFLRDDNVIIEGKMVDSLFKKKWLDENGDIKAPDHYLSQLYTYMILKDLPGKFVVVFGGNDPHVIDVPRNPKIENFIIRECVKFWEDLQAGNYPDPDDTVSCENALKALYPSSNEEMLDGDTLGLQEKLIEHMEEYKRIDAHIKDMEKVKREHKNHLVSAVQENAGIVWASGARLTYKKTKDGKKFNKELFEQENESLYNVYLDDKPGYRRLNIKL